MTMATIEQLSSALIKADAAGNTADAKRLADEIRRMRSQGAQTAEPQYASAVPQLDAQGNLIRQDAIPTTRKPSPGVLDVIAGVPEAALTLGTGAIASAVTPFAAVGEEIIQGRFGEGGPETSRRAAEMARELTYQPTTQTGRAITGAIGETLEGAGLEAIPFSQGLTAATMAPKALRQGVNLYAKEAQLADEAIQSIPAVRQTQEARVQQSYARAPQIDAANLATEYGIKLNPAVSNPSRRTRAESILVGDRDISAKFAAENAPVWTSETKKALGLADTDTLNAETFARLKNASDLTEAYDVVRKNPAFVADDATIASLDDLQAQARVGDVGGKAAAKINKKIDSIKEQLSQGVSGAVLLDSVRDLRAQASSLYSRGKPGKPLKPGDMQLAELNMATADALESMIEANLSGKALADFRAARAKYAQIYSAEAATDIATGQVDPMVFAKMVREGKPLTGPMADLGNIAANFPDIARPSAGADWLQRGATTLTRAGVPGTIGFALGNVPGAVIGAAIGEIGSRVLASRMGTPGYQRRRAVPRDYRPAAPVNALRPVEPGQSNIVPFDPRNALAQPEVPRPNFVFGRPDADVRVGVPQRQAALPAPSPESTIAALRAEDARRAAMARAAGAETEAQMAAAEAAAPRAPTTGGVTLELDPITGRLRPAAATAEPTSASTPVRLAPLADTTLEDLAAEANQPPRRVLVGGRVQNLDPRVPATGGTAFEIDPATGRLTPVAGGTEAAAGSSLASAAEKLSKGQRFALTPEEMVAWNRTAVELAELAPELNKLSPKAVAEKMMDRKWVESTIKKAREKEAAFREIEQRTRDMEMLRQARESRERLMDAMESLEAALSMPRAKEGARAKGQGPKTRAARNQLREIDTLNKLLD